VPRFLILFIKRELKSYIPWGIFASFVILNTPFLSRLVSSF